LTIISHVTDLIPRRSRGVDETLVMPLPGAKDAAGIEFDSLYRSSRDDVYAYVATLLRDRSLAEDVTASAFERAYRRRRSFVARRGTPRAWLFGIARNAALDELRRRSRSGFAISDVASTDEEPFDERMDRQLRRTAVREALSRLTPRERDLVALKFHGGLTNPELARVLGVSETNAGTLLHRTIQKLREACDEKP
jgi:RNA polymerase sigma factor (sigma-70 family)